MDKDLLINSFIAIGLGVLFLTSALLQDDVHFFLFTEENGPGELLTALLFLFIAFYSAVLRPRYIFLVICLFALFVAGEELSWGQHLFGWSTPESFAAYNKQAETNLHNLYEYGDFLDKLPRALAGLMIFMGGLVLPIARNYPAIRRIVRSYPVLDVYIPSLSVAPFALLVVMPRMLERTQVWFDLAWFEFATHPFQEFQEMAIGLFVLAYLFMYKKRRAIPGNKKPDSREEVRPDV